jgi:putative PEP-CTERM system histidine kinase
VTPFVLLPFAAAIFCVLLALTSLARRKRSPARPWFIIGMLALALDSLLTGLSLHTSQPAELVSWLTYGFTVKSLVPVVWLGFTLTYSRGDYRTRLAQWRIPLAVGLLPFVLALAYRDRLFQLMPASSEAWQLQTGALTRPLNVILLVGLVLILMNLEQTFRSAVGTMRWRIKFVVLGLAVIFGARLYIQSQAILFSSPDIALWALESSALIIGCFFLAIAYARTGFAEIDVYPSLAVVRRSLTLLLVGGYLLTVGVLAQLVKRFGGEEIFQFQAVVVLVGLSGLAVLLLSDRARQRLHVFVGRHFSKAQHDSARIWTLFSRRLARVKDQVELSTASARLISETFDVLSVNVWLMDEEQERLALAASTGRQPDGAVGDGPPRTASNAVTAGLRERSSPFDLENGSSPWLEEWRQLNPITFPEGGSRLCVPLRAVDQTLGALVLADRVSGAVYTAEELELLKCIGDQMTSSLLNLRLATEVAQAGELEAFRTMSAFFVHDLKNTAASLNLMLKNLPVHFDDPAFRQDALRGIGNTARRIDEIIGRLSALRQRPEFRPVEADLNELVVEALGRINGTPNVELTRELHPVPMILADKEQMQSVLTNLVLNARDAVGAEGRVQVRTECREGRVVLSVADNGCGMSPGFVKDSLFRPFQSTKKKGLGIGLFQSRAIVRAHGGAVHVESEPGKGTTVLVTLPVRTGK